MGMSNQTEEKDLFHAVSLSGGKDSTAMLLLMIERGLPIHAVLTADTGMEFPEMYEHLQKLDDYLFTERGPGGAVPVPETRPETDHSPAPKGL